MSVRKVLAREWTVEVDTDGGPTWAAIGGLRTIGFDMGKTDADTTDMDSGGNAEHLPAERSASVTLEGLWLEDADSGEYDEGQERLMALGDLVGVAGLGAIKFTSPGGKTWTIDCSVQFTGPGGGHNDPAGFTAVLTRSGATAKA